MKDKLMQAKIPNTQTRHLRSAIVNDEYEISIWLPPGYENSNKSYPVLYLLDTPFSFGLAINVVLGQMWDSLVPEMIIVGIGKSIDTYNEWWPIRGRDYAPVPLPNQPGSGQAEAFLRFIETELIPTIDSDFRADPDNRTIWGHSLGGAFVLYTLRNKGILFNRYIVTSPAFVVDGEIMVDHTQALMTVTPNSEVRLFVSVGTEDQEFGPNIEAFMKAVNKSSDSGLQFKLATLEGYGHISAAAPGFIRGLRAVFSD